MWGSPDLLQVVDFFFCCVAIPSGVNIDWGEGAKFVILRGGGHGGGGGGVRQYFIG